MLYKSNNLPKATNYIGFIYGFAGVGKTSLALTSLNPILIDLEKGAERAQHLKNVDVFQPNSYQEFKNFLFFNPDIKNYNTIIIDSFSELISLISFSVKKGETRQNTRQEWGIIKEAVLSTVKCLKNLNIDLIFTAHAEINDNLKKIILSAEGKAKEKLTYLIDYIGYLYRKNNNIILSFEDQLDDLDLNTKNTLYFNNKYIITELTHENLLDNIFNDAKKKKELEKTKIKKIYEKKKEENELALELIKTNISNIKTLEELNKYYNEIYKKTTVWNSYDEETNLLKNKAKELGFSFNKESKLFE